MALSMDNTPDSLGFAVERHLSRRIERLNALLMISSFLLTMHKSEYAAIYRGILLSASLLAAFVLSGFDYEITGRIALAIALVLACWLLCRVLRKRREIDSARDEIARRAQEIRDLGVPLPRIACIDPSDDDPGHDGDPKS